MTISSSSLILLLATTAAPTATYRVTAGGEVTTYQERVEVERGGEIVRVARSNDDGMLVLTRTPTLELQSWHQQSEKVGTDVVATRHGEVISIQGIVRGAKIDREVTIDARPWQQVFDVAVAAFVQSGKAREEFWALTGEELTPRVFVFERRSTVTAHAAGKEAEAVAVRFTLPGFKGAFWGSDYWVRESDMRMVKFEGTRGPSSPRMLIELVDVE